MVGLMKETSRETTYLVRRGQRRITLTRCGSRRLHVPLPLARRPTSSSTRSRPLGLAAQHSSGQRGSATLWELGAWACGVDVI